MTDLETSRQMGPNSCVALAIGTRLPSRGGRCEDSATGVHEKDVVFVSLKVFEGMIRRST